ncbi:MAG: alpha/beta hydrolase [Pseudomonadota bacterium]|nr:alpha/beta hydrolase [Pseudomonadota bacterium]
MDAGQMDAGQMDASDYWLDMEHGDVPDVLKDYAVRSEAVRNGPNAVLGLRYGPDPRERLELFKPDMPGNVPFVAFIHGGWWKGGRPEDRACLAPHFTERGIAFVSIGYPLAPAASLREIVDSIFRAMAWLGANGVAQGLDLQRMVIAGNSAGGHLAAMAASADGLAAAGLDVHGIRGLCAFSGLYDLAPLRGSYADEWLNLDDATIADCSPVRKLPPASVPVFLGIGDGEPGGFQAQTKDFASLLRESGRSAETAIVPDRHHFSVIADIGAPGSAPFNFILKQLGDQTP